MLQHAFWPCVHQCHLSSRRPALASTSCRSSELSGEAQLVELFATHNVVILAIGNLGEKSSLQLNRFFFVLRTLVLQSSHVKYFRKNMGDFFFWDQVFFIATCCEMGHWLMLFPWARGMLASGPWSWRWLKPRCNHLHSKGPPLGPNMQQRCFREGNLGGGRLTGKGWKLPPGAFGATIEHIQVGFGEVILLPSSWNTELG